MPSQRRSLFRRLLIFLVTGFLGLTLLVFAIAVFESPPSAGFWICLLSLGGAGWLFSVAFSSLDNEGGEKRSAPPVFARASESPREMGGEIDFDAISSDHRSELVDFPTPEQRWAALETWRSTLEKLEPSYHDTIVRHAMRDRIAEMHAQTIMRALIAGYAAGRGWMPVIQAQARSGLLGRELRDFLRSLGIPLEDISLNVGTSTNDAALAVINSGIELGRTAAELPVIHPQ